MSWIGSGFSAAADMSGESGSGGNRARRGTILIVAMSVLLILAGFVLVFARAMRVEAIASANRLAAGQAEAIERAAEQYCIAQLVDQKESVFTLDDSSFAGVQVGDGYFWIIRPDYGDPQLPSFGFVDEASKLNINTATLDMLEALPGMTPDLAAAVIDWRDEDDNPTANGAESDYYMTLPQPYMAKNSQFETVEELLLVKGFTRQLLYGPIATGASASQSGFVTDESLARGLYDLLTVYSVEPNMANLTGGGQQGSGKQSSGSPSAGGGSSGGGTSQPSTATGRININHAPREVLLCLPGLDDNDVSSLLAHRYAGSSDPTDISWVQQALPAEKYNNIRTLITGNSYQYSAEIVAVSGNGRAFRRCRIVIDTRSTTPRIVYRRDLSDTGWPLAPEILDSLRQGAGLPASAYLPAVRRAM